MSKEYRLPENIKPQDLVRGIINASYWHWRNIDKIQHTEAIKYLNNLESIDNSNSSEALKCLENIDLFMREEDYDYCQVGDYDKDYNTIKQILIKTQKIGKENKSYKLVLKNINKLVADAYNSKISFELAINCINEILKEVDWRDKDEVK